mgnify:CR=1 FL=1
MSHTPPCLSGEYAVEHFANPGQTGGHHQVTRQYAAAGVDRGLLAETVQALDAGCLKLLRALYREERAVSEVRAELGLGSVQAVYHRRNVCIRKAQALLNRRLLGRRKGRNTDGGPAAGPQRQPARY